MSGEILRGIRKDLVELRKRFNDVGTLGRRNDEKLVEARAELIRVGRKINAIIDNSESAHE